MKGKTVCLYITLTSILLLLKGKLQWPSGSLQNEWKRKERKKRILRRVNETEKRWGGKYLAAPRGLPPCSRAGRKNRGTGSKRKMAIVVLPVVGGNNESRHLQLHYYGQSSSVLVLNCHLYNLQNWSERFAIFFYIFSVDEYKSKKHPQVFAFGISDRRVCMIIRESTNKPQQYIDRIFGYFFMLSSLVVYFDSLFSNTKTLGVVIPRAHLYIHELLWRYWLEIHISPSPLDFIQIVYNNLSIFLYEKECVCSAINYIRHFFLHLRTITANSFLFNFKVYTVY